MSSHGTYIGVGNFNVNISNLSVVTSMGYYGVWEFHGIIMIIVWCILYNLSFITITLFKHTYLGNYIHRVCGFITTILTIVVGIIGIATSATSPNEDKAAELYHLVFGIFQILSLDKTFMFRVYTFFLSISFSSTPRRQ